MKQHKRRNLHVFVTIHYSVFPLESESVFLQCVQKKRTTYFQTAVTPFRIVEIKKVRRDSERARVDLSNAYNYFPVTQQGAELFEFKEIGQETQKLKIEEIASTDENLMPHIIEAVKHKVTIGEVCNSLRKVWGEYRPKDIL